MHKPSPKLEKKIYSPPQLLVYGTVRELTLGKTPKRGTDHSHAFPGT